MVVNHRERIGDVEVAFDDRGEGPATVLLNPFPFDRRVWADNVPALVAAQRRVVTVDYPGFGDSPPPTLPLSIAGLGDLVGGVLDSLEIRTATLVGLSMGGYVALAFASAFPNRLDALVLADTLAASDGLAALQSRTQALALIREKGVDAYLDQSLSRLLAPNAAPELSTLTRSLAEKRPEALVAGIAALRDRPDRTAGLARLRCPTLVLVGECDQVSPAVEMRAMAAAIPNALFVEIPGAGHLSNLEAPVAFTRALLAFLQRELQGDLTTTTAGTTTTKGSVTATNTGTDKATATDKAP